MRRSISSSPATRTGMTACSFADRSKCREYLGNSHALVLPSRYEGLRLTVVEAMLLRPAGHRNGRGWQP